MQKIYTGDKVFSGSNFLPDHAIITNDGSIIDVLPTVSLPTDCKINFHAHIVTASFIDTQIYGASERLFASYPTANSLQLLYEHCLKGGTRCVVPTVATNTYNVFKQCIDAVREYWKKDGKGVYGLHLEGPWINKVRRGAHIENLIQVPSLEDVKDLIEYGKGVIKIITLAPEMVDVRVIRFLRSHDIIVSIGHSDATFSQAMDGFDNGAHAVTHLFNAMSPLHHRKPGLAAALFQHPQVMSSIIVDGYHVDFQMISIAKKLLGERLFLITDAVTESSDSVYQHKFDNDKYICDGTLSGSALTMIQAVINCIIKVGIKEEEALRMATVYPARLLGIDGHIGMIRKGYSAALTFLDKEWNVLLPEYSSK